MKFLHYGKLHVAARISGPRHNYLAVTFAPDGGETAPQIVELPPQGGCEHRPLDASKILEAVLLGVEQGNAAFATNYVVQAVQFIENDTGPEEVYRHMAYCLVEAIKQDLAAKRADFEQLTKDD